MKLLPTKINDKVINYSFFMNEEQVGISNIRLIPAVNDESLKGFENHIYYEIFPQFRGNGYGTELLKMTISQAKILGIDSPILICENDNTPSRTIIESICGKPVDTKISSDGNICNKYIIVV